NSVIKAGGLITIEPNVTFGNNVLVVSSIGIDLQEPNSIEPTVELRIEPLNEILFNCTNYDFAYLHNTRDEINQFCNKAEYRNIVYSTAPKSDDENEECDNNKLPSDFDFKLIPNPSSGQFTIEFNGSLTKFEIEILDEIGRAS